MSRNSKNKRDAKQRQKAKAVRRHLSKGHDPNTCSECQGDRKAMLEEFAAFAPELNHMTDGSFDGSPTREYAYRAGPEAPSARTREGVDRAVHGALKAMLECIDIDEGEWKSYVWEALETISEDPRPDAADGATAPLKDGTIQIQVIKEVIPNTMTRTLRATTHAQLSMSGPQGSFCCRFSVSQQLLREDIGFWPSDPGMRAELELVADRPMTDEWLVSNPAPSALLTYMGDLLPFRIPGNGIRPIFDQSKVVLESIEVVAQSLETANSARTKIQGLERELATTRASRDAARRQSAELDASLSQARTKLLALNSSRQGEAQHTNTSDAPSSATLIDELQSKLARQTSIAEDRQAENDALRGELYELQKSINTLINAKAIEPTEVVEYPADFTELRSWAAANLKGRVHLHPRAVTAAEESNYQNPAKVYACLQALSELYWPLLYDTAKRDPAAWEARCAELGVECSRVGVAATEARTADSYTMTHNGKRLVADMHLRGNSSFDPRFGLRIYWARDDEAKQIVVCSLPTHLPRRVS